MKTESFEWDAVWNCFLSFQSFLFFSLYQQVIDSRNGSPIPQSLSEWQTSNLIKTHLTHTHISGCPHPFKHWYICTKIQCPGPGSLLDFRDGFLFSVPQLGWKTIHCEKSAQRLFRNAHQIISLRIFFFWKPWHEHNFDKKIIIKTTVNVYNLFVFRQWRNHCIRTVFKHTHVLLQSVQWRSIPRSLQ